MPAAVTRILLIHVLVQGGNVGVGAGVGVGVGVTVGVTEGVGAGGITSSNTNP